MIDWEKEQEMKAKLAQDFWFMNTYEYQIEDDDFSWDKNCFPIEFGPGWYEIFYNFCRQLLTEVKSDFHWTQLKEKYGTANCYYTGGITKYGQELIEQFEKDSAEICEWCGKPGKTRNVGNWYVTLCDDCLDKYNKEY